MVDVNCEAGEKKSQNQVELNDILREISDTMPGAIYQFAMTSDGAFSMPFLSQSAEALLGLPTDVLKESSRIFEGILSDDKDDFAASVRKSSIDLSPWNHEFRFERPDGSTLWIRGSSIPCKRSDGSVVWNGILLDITAQKKAEEELGLWIDIFDNTDLGIAVADAGSDRFSYVNKAFAQLYGYTPEEFDGEPIARIFHPDCIGDLSEHIATVEREGRHVFESVHIRRDGSTFPAVIDVTAVKDKDGTPRYRVANVRDISEAKHREQVLQSSQDRYKRLSEATFEGIAITKDGKIIDVNEQIFDIYQLTPEEFKSSDMTTLVHPDDLGKVISNIQNRLTERYEHRGIRKDGTVVDLEVRARYVGTGDDEYRLTVIRDITEQKRMERKLRRSEERHRIVSSISSDFVYSMDENAMEIKWFSGAFEEITGYSAEQMNLLPEKWVSIIHPDDRESTTARVFKDVANRVGNSYEYRIITKSGDVKWIVDKFRPIIDESTGGISSIFGAVRDVSETKGMREQVRQAEKMQAIGQLAGGIAHDFNNVLAGIIGFVELALSDTPEGTRLHKNLSRILEAADRAKDLVKQILTFSRKRVHYKQAIGLDSVVNEAMGLLRASIPSSVIIDTVIQPEISAVYADATNIYEVIMNLCTNGVHAMEERGTLTVKLYEETVASGIRGELGEVEPGRYCVLEVSDTGMGMDDDVRSRVFEPFFTTKEHGQGTGMGLSVVFGVMQSHGGNILLETMLGEGTSVRVLLPVARETEISPQAHSEVPPGGTEKILFVDDEQLIVDMSIQMLESLGYEVAAFSKPIKALEVFTEDPSRFDMLITDQTMPAMTGMELATKVRSVRADLPIVLCTGFSSVLDEDMIRTLGRSRLMFKPLAKREFAKVIREVLRMGEG